MMDLKTLEYMEERVKKAKRLIEDIEQLKNNISKMNRIKVVRFVYENWSTSFDSSIGSLTNEMKEAYIQAAENEIGLLEKKLAEL